MNSTRNDRERKKETKIRMKTEAKRSGEVSERERATTEQKTGK